MQTVWIDPKDELPPQGVFVLCWDDGIAYTARRMGEYWFQAPFTDSAFAWYEAPEKWSYIQFPQGVSGRIRFKEPDGDLIYSADEFELFHPTEFNKCVEMLKRLMDDRERKELTNKPPRLNTSRVR